jgi:hypothetical protein
MNTQTVKSIKMLEGLHLTQTEKKQITAIINKGWESAHTKNKSYLIKKIYNDNFAVQITSKEFNDYGKRDDRTRKYVVRAS